MKTIDLLHLLRARSARLASTPDGDLHCRAPRGLLTPDLVHQLRTHKEEILAILQQETARSMAVPSPTTPAPARSLPPADANATNAVCHLRESGFIVNLHGGRPYIEWLGAGDPPGGSHRLVELIESGDGPSLRLLQHERDVLARIGKRVETPEGAGVLLDFFVHIRRARVAIEGQDESRLFGPEELTWDQEEHDDDR